LRTALAAAVLGSLLAAPVAAWADETMSATPPNRYSSTDVQIDQGEKVTFTNYDTVDHDVVAREKGPDGKPLFASALVSRGGSAPVNGTEYLTTGSYAFLCSIHPQMTGKFTVSSAGTPAQRPAPPPSGGGAPPPAPGGGAADPPPRVAVKVLDSRISSLRRRRTLRLGFAVDEPVTVRVTARAAGRTLGRATVRLNRVGERTVTVRLSRTTLRRLRRARRLSVSLTGSVTDAAGNAVTIRSRRTLRR
jgi:plastocyanin